MRQVPAFEAKDGKLFTSEAACRLHEETILKQDHLASIANRLCGVQDKSGHPIIPASVNAFDLAKALDRMLQEKNFRNTLIQLIEYYEP